MHRSLTFRRGQLLSRSLPSSRHTRSAKGFFNKARVTRPHGISLRCEAFVEDLVGCDLPDKGRHRHLVSGRCYGSFAFARMKTAPINADVLTLAFAVSCGALAFVPACNGSVAPTTSKSADSGSRSLNLDASVSRADASPSSGVDSAADGGPISPTIVGRSRLLLLLLGSRLCFEPMLVRGVLADWVRGRPLRSMPSGLAGASRRTIRPLLSD